MGAGSWSAPGGNGGFPLMGKLCLCWTRETTASPCAAGTSGTPTVSIPLVGDKGETKLNGATGLLFRRQLASIRRQGNERVIRCDTEGHITGVFEKPDSPLFPQDKQYLPTRVAADTNGVVYVICEGIDQGAVMYPQRARSLAISAATRCRPLLTCCSTA